MEKIVVVIMGQNCEKFIGMALDSVEEADAIVYCDGGSTDNTLMIVKNNRVTDNLYQEYYQEDKGMNGKQRNFYLDYVKKNYSGYWCLCIDADEVVEDLNRIKEYIQFAAKDKLYSIKMRHFIGDLGHEDSTVPIHFVMHRLFYVGDDLSYPEVEHPVLQGDRETIPCMITNIWHLAYVPSMWDIKKKYENHMKKSNMHTQEFLKNWYWQHLFGVYPKNRINVMEIPNIIMKEFGVDKDEIYVLDRIQMEAKHYQDAIDWNDFFKPKRALIYGCGVGQRVYTMNKMGINTVGLEINPHAVVRRKHENVILGDITTDFKENNDLVIAYDVLEHLDKDDLDKAIENMIKSTNKYILISVPVIGNPQLDIDSTHKIRETENWWINKFKEKKLKKIDTPDNFGYKEQIYIFEKC